MRHHGVKQPHQHVGGFPYSPAVIDRRLTLELGERALERVGKFVNTYSRASGYKLHRSMTAVMGRDYYWKSVNQTRACWDMIAIPLPDNWIDWRRMLAALRSRHS